MLTQQFEEPRQVFLVDPVQHESVRRIDAQLVAFGFDL